MRTFFFFFFNDTATTEIYTLSLHDALPISRPPHTPHEGRAGAPLRGPRVRRPLVEDRKSTRLNSSHGYISYAVFCLKKKKRQQTAEDAPRVTRACRDGSRSALALRARHPPN